MSEFVATHNISCFACGRTDQRWHLTGRKQTGRPWAICTNCRRKSP